MKHPSKLIESRKKVIYVKLPTTSIKISYFRIFRFGACTDVPSIKVIAQANQQITTLTNFVGI